MSNWWNSDFARIAVVNPELGVARTFAAYAPVARAVMRSARVHLDFMSGAFRLPVYGVTAAARVDGDHQAAADREHREPKARDGADAGVAPVKPGGGGDSDDCRVRAGVGCIERSAFRLVTRC